MLQKRFHLAKVHKLWTFEDWNRVCFSDEMIFWVLDDGVHFVPRHLGKEYPDLCIISAVNYSIKVMAWFVNSVEGVKRLYMIESTLRQDQYVKVLKTRLLSQLTEWLSEDQNVLFLQNPALRHTAKVSKKLLSYHSLLLWSCPGNLPDLN